MTIPAKWIQYFQKHEARIETDTNTGNKDETLIMNTKICLIANDNREKMRKSIISNVRCYKKEMMDHRSKF